MNTLTHRRVFTLYPFSLIAMGCSKVNSCPQRGQVCGLLDQTDEIGFLGHNVIYYRILSAPQRLRRASVTSNESVGSHLSIHSNGRVLGVLRSDGFLLRGAGQVVAFSTTGNVELVSIMESTNMAYALVRTKGRMSINIFKADSGTFIREVNLPLLSGAVQLSSNRDYICLSTIRKTMLIPVQGDKVDQIFELGFAEICPNNNSIVGIASDECVAVVAVATGKSEFKSKSNAAWPRWHSKDRKSTRLNSSHG